MASHRVDELRRAAEVIGRAAAGMGIGAAPEPVRLRAA
jgi:hypothetical protein